MRNKRCPLPSLPFVALNTHTCKITDSDSASNTPPISNKGQRLFESSAIALRAAPIANEPVSPMNTWAGLRLCNKKPSQAPASAAQNPARAGSPLLPRSISCSPKPINTIAPTPAAKPSRPSVRFVALLSAKNTNKARGQINKPSGNHQPKGRAMLDGIASWSAAQSKNKPAARACSNNLPLALRPLFVCFVRLRQSSIPPITKKASVTSATGIRR